MAGSFLGTNILVYLAQSDARKAEHVEALLRAEPVVSVQVLNELANVLRRKAAFSWPETRSFMAIVRDLAKVVPLVHPHRETAKAPGRKPFFVSSPVHLRRRPERQLTKAAARPSLTLGLVRKRTYPAIPL